MFRNIVSKYFDTCYIPYCSKVLNENVICLFRHACYFPRFRHMLHPTESSHLAHYSILPLSRRSETFGLKVVLLIEQH